MNSSEKTLVNLVGSMYNYLYCRILTDPDTTPGTGTDGINQATKSCNVQTHNTGVDLTLSESKHLHELWRYHLIVWNEQ